MSVLKTQISTAIAEASSDESVAKRFLELWPVVEKILEAFARATKLPILVYLNNHHIYHTSGGTMPEFCRLMLGDDTTRQLCIQDGLRRAKGEEPEVSEGLQLCHAGLINGRRTVDVSPLGTLVLLFGSRAYDKEDGHVRRRKVLGSLPENAASKNLVAAAEQLPSGAIGREGRSLIDSIALMLQTLFRVSLEFYWSSVNMAHELSQIWLPAGLAVQELREDLMEVAWLLKKESSAELQTAPTKHEPTIMLQEAIDDIDPVFAECQLSSFVVRNFLSHVSEIRYKEALGGKFQRIEIDSLLREMVALHERAAACKGIAIEIEEPLGLPPVRGIDSELRRALHNLLSNALKYSYHSTPRARRTIRVWSKVPYDPGFRSRRFSIVIQNYGLGVEEHELREIMKPGTRGRQAHAEVPIGSGVGLSEVSKIASLHHGAFKFRSQEMHRSAEGVPTFLTEAELILPYYNQGSR
jgi:signal transduction histidine kinase